MEYQEIIDLKLPSFDIITGIYFLIKNDKIVYVGQSTNIVHRIMTHIKSGKSFDYFSYIKTDGDLDETELHYIIKFKPPYNLVVPKNNILLTYKELQNKLEISWSKLRKFIETKNISPYNGRYHVDEFKYIHEWIDMEGWKKA